jgi:predicted transcriptional regulator
VTFRGAPRAAQGPPEGASDSLASFLGPLEVQVLERLWRRPGETSVRRIQEDFPAAAYTTLMTTLDRLFKKGLLTRTRKGKAFHYATRFTRAGLREHLAKGAIARILGSGPGRGAVRPILSTFVEAVSEKDALLLDELEALIRAERNRVKGKVETR